MKKVYCLILLCISLQSVNAQIIDIPDNKFKNALVNINCVDSDFDGILDSPADTDNDGEISLDEALAVKTLNLRHQGILVFTGLESFSNLESLVISQNYTVTSVDVTNMPNLKILFCFDLNLAEIDLSQNPELISFGSGGNPLKALDFSNNLKLKNVLIQSCQLDSIDLTGLTALEELNISSNNLKSLKVENKPSFRELYCSYGMLEILTLSNLPNLEILYCFENSLTRLDVGGMASLKKLYCNENQLNHLNIIGAEGLEGILCQENELPELELGFHPKLEQLWCFENQIKGLNLDGTKNLKGLYCNNNQITELELTSLPRLTFVSCHNNLLTSLIISDLDSLDQLKCENNQLSRLALNRLPKLRNINATNNLLDQIDFNNSNAVQYLRINNNQLTHLDLSNFRLLKSATCVNNKLNTLILKNGVIDENLDFRLNPDLEYICIDKEEEDYISNYLLQFSQDMVELNSYCSFDPGSDYGIVKGDFHIAESIADCNSGVVFNEYVKINIESKMDTSFVIHNTVQEYQIPLVEDTFLLRPTIGELGYYSVDPESVEVVFPQDPNPFIQDFCVYKRGAFNDLDIVIIPLDVAVPGFESNYKLIYSNKGTTTQSGTILLTFMDNLVEFNSSNPASSIQNLNQLTWNFLDIEPFEKRTIDIKFTLNTPTDNPPLNNGDVISMNTVISSLETDETINDNLFTLEEVVVNSYDPNDKQCLQGSTIPVSKIDEEIFYMVRFENTGTAHARNVVVKDEIDISLFDFSSIQLVDASHDVRLRKADQNIIEFIFEQINLPFEEEKNQGFVVFKIKLNNNLVPGNLVKNSANIYFDFNHPIITDTFEFVIVEDFEEDNDLDGYSHLNDCNDNDYSINPGVSEIAYNGLDDDCNELTLDDDIDQDGFLLIDDCDDNNYNINPNQTEIPYNGADDDCNPVTLDDDFDQDGFLLVDDCDDNNPNINPDQTEEPYNGIDDDCDITTLDDDIDQDGFLLVDDCDDNNYSINPSQTEIHYNGADDDCNITTFDDDLDQDGFLLINDCDDNNANINPSQTEIPYNGVDDDCNTITFDDDLDQDGFLLIDDCDDNNANINPSQTEIPYNGVDDDCNTTTFDDDLDQDGFLLIDDCDDNNYSINPSQMEIPYNGADDDCNPVTLDDDFDQDGFLLIDDCDDNNPNINPDAIEIPNNGIDEDCDGSDLISSIHEIANSTINIYPNPATDIINIEVTGKLNYNANLYDLGGKLIISTTNQSTIQIQSLNQGTYLLVIKQINSDQKIVKTIVKGN